MCSTGSAVSRSYTKMARRPTDLIYGAALTKLVRQERFGRAAGGAETTNVEKYQRKAVEDGTGIGCIKTNYRINFRTNTIEECSKPLDADNGFDYTEDFDGLQITPFGRILISFKSVVGAGGNQTRTLRECYHFAEAQLKLLAFGEKSHFANILDGDEAHKRVKHFAHLTSLPEYSPFAKKIYIGDLGGYFDWFNKCATIE